MKSILRACAICTTLAVASSPALAEWPERPVTIVVSQSAGASPDIMARLIADGLSKVTGGNFIVENRPGGSNVVGASSVATAEPDGYTLFFATSAALVTNPYVLKDLPYDPMEDFDPISPIAMSQLVVAANPDAGIDTLEDIITMAKEDPASISIGVDSPRNLSGIIARAIGASTGTDLTLVSYNNIPQSVQDAVAGVIPVIVQSESVVSPYLADGSLKAIAVAGGTRSAVLPDVPTISETIKGIDLKGWFMMVAPDGLDPAIAEELNGAIRQVLQDPAVVELADNLGFELVGDVDVAGAETFLGQEMQAWGDITTQLGIQPE
jgi:tripartite-type tricarboxylate transporter receptor subunit TctC